MPLLLAASAAAPPAICVPAGRWVDAQGAPITADDVLGKLRGAQFALLGEEHANAAHHRWQADMIARVATTGRPVVIGLEQLPRAAQGALDAYAAGTIDEADFLAQSRWAQVWGHDFAAYRPIFAVARRYRLPMIALNIDRAFVRRVAREGYTAAVGDAAPVGRPAPPPPAYAAMLREVFAAHGGKANAAAVERFIEAQTIWDRAMAERMAEAARARPDALIVGVMGAGHVRGGHGVAHQLRALGLPRSVALLPVRSAPPCDGRRADADASFGVHSK